MFLGELFTSIRSLGLQWCNRTLSESILSSPRACYAIHSEHSYFKQQPELFRTPTSDDLPQHLLAVYFRWGLPEEGAVNK